MTSLEDLTARLQAATGADRELDWAIADATNHPSFATRFEHMWPPFGIGSSLDCAIPDYTASVDAALALVEKVLPDHFMTLKTKTGGAFHHCEIEGEDDGEWKAVNVPSPALAIILALLRSLLNTTEGGEL